MPWLATNIVDLPRQCAQKALGLLFPPMCAVCREEGSAGTDRVLLCAGCRRKMLPDEPPCPRCGATFEPDEEVVHVADTRDVPLGPVPGELQWGTTLACCRCANSRFPFDCIICLGSYRRLRRDVVLRMKHVSQTPLSLAAGRLLYEQTEPLLRAVEADLIVPVPMHWARRMARGVNSPDLLAEALSRGLRVPCAGGALFRHRNTLPQKELPPGERMPNVRGAFRAGSGYDIKGARVLLVDDVLTTGATCREASRTLRASGAARVSVAVLARAEGKALW